MKANELRIGNLIGCDISTLVVKAINDETVICHTMSGKPYVLHLEDVYGLKLTEEWLVKFGFQYNEILDLYIMKDSNFISLCQNITKEYWTDFESYYGLSYLEIKYVHQLQNLYYALTGQELTIKE